jgi:hypothetical protein
MLSAASPQLNHHKIARLVASRKAVLLSRFVVVGLVLLTILLGPMVEPASAAGVKKSKCDATAGWAFVGRPANLARLGPDGVYVWVEKSGVWRISTTHANRRVQKISGSITFDSPVVGKPSGSEGTFGDVSVPSPNVVNFSFANYGGVDGISISSPCSTTVTLNASIDDAPIAPTQLFVGAAGTNPTSVPLSMTRTASSPGAQPAVSNVGGSSAVVVPSPGVAVTTASTGPVPTPVISLPAAASATSAAAPACSVGGWPAVLAGRPKLLSAKVIPQGVYLWVEKNVLKVQAIVDGPQPSIVVGRISANATVTVVGVGLEGKRDVVKSDGSTVSFSLRVNRASDGFELTSLCATQFIVEATIDDVVAPLFLGANSAPIPAQPYLVAK